MESKCGEGFPATAFLLCGMFLFTPVFTGFGSDCYILLAGVSWKLFCVQKVFVGKGK